MQGSRWPINHVNKPAFPPTLFPNSFPPCEASGNILMENKGPGRGAGGGLSSQASTSGPPELPRVRRAEHGISPSFCRACSFLEQRFLRARILHARSQLERILRNLEGLKSPFHVFR